MSYLYVYGQFVSSTSLDKSFVLCCFWNGYYFLRTSHSQIQIFTERFDAHHKFLRIYRLDAYSIEKQKKLSSFRGRKLCSAVPPQFTAQYCECSPALTCLILFQYLFLNPNFEINQSSTGLRCNGLTRAVLLIHRDFLQLHFRATFRVR